jgi:serine/threonine protein kinase
VESLGTGGTSTVWLARQLSLDRVVAIKILSPALLADPAARAQFQKEALAAGKLSNPSIVGILDFGEHEGTLYYVMEYVPGTNLADWLAANTRMAHAQVLKLAEILATALDAVWRETGIIHCDIKPGNILLTTDGAVKLTDLGLARIAGDAATREASSCIEGTPTYIAPEQIEGEPPDFRSDIYSLGLTLYHLLTGNPPFEGRSLDEILDAQQTDYLPDPCDLLPNLPVAYAWLLAKMTAKNPDGRPTSWAEVLKDIRQIQKGKSPLPPYPAEDASTILLNPRHRPAPKAHASPSVRAAKGRITLSSSDQVLLQKQPSAAKAASSRSGGLKILLFLVVLAGAFYALYHFKLKDDPHFQTLFEKKARHPPPSLPERSNGVSGTADATLEPPATAEEELDPELFTPQIETDASRTGTTTPGAWNQPEFIQAAKTFNRALSAYRLAQEHPDPANPAWSAILSDAQQAAQAFEALRPDAPPSVPITLYANQSYQLINDARRARLTADDKKALHAAAPKKRHPTLAPYPTPPVPADDAFAAHHMQFGYAWETLPAPTERPEGTEWLFLISSLGLNATPDTRVQTDVRLHGPLTWGMPLDQAVARLGTVPTPRVPVEGAPFPFGGFFMHAYPAGRFGAIAANRAPYPTIRLITDAEDRLAAVQLVDTHPEPPLQNQPSAFSGMSKVMDFVTGQLLPEQGDLRSVHRLLKGNRSLRLDTEVADFSEDPANGVPVYRSVLYLPQALAQNLIYHVLGTP